MSSELNTIQWLVFFLLLVLTTRVAAQTVSPKLLTYCYETTELLPHFTGNGADVPKNNPGAAIEILQNLDANLAEITINFVRKPWLRCLRELESGKVSAVIGSYSQARAKFAMFPILNNKPDNRFAFSQTKSCLLQQKPAVIAWDGKNFDFSNKDNAKGKKATIALPRGYKIIDTLQKFGFNVYTTHSASNAHELLFKNRVIASVSLCNFNDYPDHIVKNPIPIRTHYGYLMFSKDFYSQNPSLSKKIWQALKDIDKNYYYRKYKDYSSIANN